MPIDNMLRKGIDTTWGINLSREVQYDVYSYTIIRVIDKRTFYGTGYNAHLSTEIMYYPIYNKQQRIHHKP